MSKILCFVAAALMALMLAAPAFAGDKNHGDRQQDRHLFNHLLNKADNQSDLFDNDSLFLFSPFVFDDELELDDELSDCPFLGDFEGVVNQFDCFD